MTQLDPTEDDGPHTYECVECGERIKAETRPGRCRDCGGDLRNISRPRQQ